MEDFRVTLQKKPSALTENIQQFKTQISKFFILLYVIFALLDSDADNESGYGSTDLTESGSGSRSETL
jgi:hypothetical protein